jgi:hypothetical protein
MPAQSKAQQKAAGAALSAKRGETKVGDLQGASKQMYDSMSEEELEEVLFPPDIYTEDKTYWADLPYLKKMVCAVHLIWAWLKAAVTTPVHLAQLALHVNSIKQIKYYFAQVGMYKKRALQTLF